MNAPEVLAVFVAGLAAGTINTIVGSGSLITFPTLVALGYSPVIANVTNTVGLVPGSISGVVGYRRELRGQRARVIRYGLLGLAGGVTGAILLLALPASAFGRIVPFLILGACVLVALQPRLSRLVAARSSASARNGGRRAEGPGAALAEDVALGEDVDPAGSDAEAAPGAYPRLVDAAPPRLLDVLVYATGIYGGYFGAAQGVILIALFGIFLVDDIQRLNALKNVLQTLVNAVAGVIFIVVSHPAWGAAVALALGAIVGGQLGAVIGRRLPRDVLRAIIVVVGTVVGVRMLLA